MGKVLSVPGSTERADLRTVYQALMTSAIDLRARIWETMKTAALLFTGVLAAAGGIAVREETPLWALAVVGAVLIAFGAVLALWSHRNAMREQDLQMHFEFALYQIEMLLGLHDKIEAPSQWLKGYEHLFDKKHVAPEFDRKAGDLETQYVDKRLAQTRFRWTSRVFSWVLLFGPFFVFGALLFLLASGSGKSQKATTMDAPTKQSLPTVNLSQAPNAGQISADTSDKKSNPPPTDWIVWFTGALVFVGVTQVVVYFIQARYMRTGLKLTRQAANAAQESAKVATQQTSIMASRERPWIMVKPDWPLPDTQTPFGGPVKWSATNVGRSPAFLTKLVAVANVVAYPIPDRQPEYPQPEPFAKFIIPPNGNHGSKVGTALDASQLQSIFDGKRCLLFYGFIDYNDSLGDSHQTRFCCIWRMKNGEWLFEPVGPPSYIEYT